MHHRIHHGLLRALIVLSILWVASPLAMAEQPITTDSRIKTFVYNANEVFSITTHYGYQSNVEFGTKETIETVSVGDRVGWQIIPAGRRLFIRAMEENAHTNMTIVTNQRAYQFDLRSSNADAVFGSEELTYVVRFFYPDDVASGAPMPTTSISNVSPLVSQPVGYQPPVGYGATSPATPAYPIASTSIATAPLPATATPTTTAPVANNNPAPTAINYRYTYSGPNDIAPVKIYDDGRSTYFKFSGTGNPRIAVITARGETIEVPSRRTGDGLIAVDVVAPRLSIYQSGRQVVVYNEAAG